MARPAQAASMDAPDGSPPSEQAASQAGSAAAASTGTHRHPSGHTFDETESRCLTCGWEFRTVQVVTSRAKIDPESGLSTGKDSTLPSHQYKQSPQEDWRPVWQDGTLPARWPRCPNPAPDETVEDLEA